ncbi:MAG: 2-hydroxyacid dehydrogenase, partial [Shewanella sp.]
MRVGFFSAKQYDMEYFNRTNVDFGAQIEYFDYRLCMQTVKLAEGFEIICAFVNDSLNEEVLTELAKGGTKIIAMRCAGFNNVDLVAAKRLGMQVVNVPAYSP